MIQMSEMMSISVRKWVSGRQQ